VAYFGQYHPALDLLQLRQDRAAVAHPKRPRKRDAGSEMTIMDKVNRVALLGRRPIG
jgi:hypothetical protein